MDGIATRVDAFLACLIKSDFESALAGAGAAGTTGTALTGAACGAAGVSGVGASLGPLSFGANPRDPVEAVSVPRTA